jgi:hypothetical protein
MALLVKICPGVLPFGSGDRDLFPSPSNRDFLPLGDWGFPGDFHREAWFPEFADAR